VKQNWPRGLPLLSRGDDEPLRDLAAAELKNPTAAEEQAALADRWWDWSEKGGLLERRAARRRAVHWYKQALPTLPASLASGRAKQRVAEVEKEEQPAKPGSSAASTAKQRPR
jgi:hypothetical protein